ncbi:MAG: cyclic nucleotide-binding domain-containing protein [Leptospirales bacterium]
MIEKSYSMKKLLLLQGEVCQQMRFVISGIARTYFIDPDGKEFTWSIHYSNPQLLEKNLFLLDYHSFLTQTPSKLYIEAITDIKVLEMDNNFILSLYEKSKYWNQVGRIITENVYLYTHNRTFSLLTLSAKERYKTLCKEEPLLMSIIPQHYLATYLGITPESLSRLKKSS